MHESVREAIRDELDSRPSLVTATEKEAADLALRVGAVFTRDGPNSWMWSSLKTPSVASEYGEGDCLGLIALLLGDSVETVHVALTDDSAPPWITISGQLQLVLELLFNLPCMEFFICDETFAWIIFDTHHNCLVASWANELGFSLVGGLKQV
jgi:hypothetical protein